MLHVFTHAHKYRRSISKSSRTMREFCRGAVRLHIFDQAAHGEVSGGFTFLILRPAPCDGLVAPAAACSTWGEAACGTGRTGSCSYAEIDPGNCLYLASDYRSLPGSNELCDLERWERSCMPLRWFFVRPRLLRVVTGGSGGGNVYLAGSAAYYKRSARRLSLGEPAQASEG